MTERVKELAAQNEFSFSDLCEIVAILRAPGGCPWDAEQTHQSVRRALIEETYEVIEAIDRKDDTLLREELGDLMFQVLFHATLAQESGRFTIDDVITDIAKKMIHRHPHVFGEKKAEDAASVVTTWESIKNEEKSRESIYDRLSSVPPMLPALLRAQKLAERMNKMSLGRTEGQAIASVEAAVDLLKNGTSQKEKELACGLLASSLASYAAAVGLDAEQALQDENRRLVEKFRDL